MPDLKLGKTPATADDRDLKLATYLKTSVLPKPPAAFGHEEQVIAHYPGWGMLGNDRYGDCVWAGAAHEHMLWSSAAGMPEMFTERLVLADYAACTGFDPADPATDQGTDVRKAMGYRRKIGVASDYGGRHRIEAYAAIDPKDRTTIRTALYLFGAVGIGIEFPESAMDQFNAGKGWSLVKGSKVDGGHYVPLVAYRGTPLLVTWGKLISVTWEFLDAYCDEAWCALSPDALVKGRSLEGFDDKALLADLRTVSR